MSIINLSAHRPKKPDKARRPFEPCTTANMSPGELAALIERTPKGFVPVLWKGTFVHLSKRVLIAMGPANRAEIIELTPELSQVARSMAYMTECEQKTFVDWLEAMAVPSKERPAV